MRRVAEALLEGAAGPGSSCGVAVRADATHGQVISVTLPAGDAAQRERVAAIVHAKLGPLTVRHEVL